MPEINEIYLSLLLGLLAFVYSNVLTDTDMLLFNFYKWCENNMPMWLFKPVIGCMWCVGGQLSFWVYLYYNPIEYCLLAHLICISISIFATEMSYKIWNLNFK